VGAFSRSRAFEVLLGQQVALHVPLCLQLGDEPLCVLLQHVLCSGPVLALGNVELEHLRKVGLAQFIRILADNRGAPHGQEQQDDEDFQHHVIFVRFVGHLLA
jgi:hypothetical protein